MIAREAKSCKRCHHRIPPTQDACVWAPHLIVNLCERCLKDMRTWIREGVNK